MTQRAMMGLARILSKNKERRNPISTLQARKAPLHCQYYEEPSLKFAGGRLHVDPKMGISIFGPRTLDHPNRHPDKVKVGLIGSGQSTDSAVNWIQSCSAGVAGGEELIDFPGYASDRGFFSSVVIDNDFTETISRNDLSRMLEPKSSREKFQTSIELFSDKMRLLAERDHPPDYVVLAIPDEIVKACGTVDYIDGECGMIHRDLRRAMKSEAMKYRIPTQFLLQRTTEATEQSPTVEHRSICAWNFFTGLYFKTGGIPWGPTELSPGSCYIGISFFRPLGSPSSIRTSVAQAFDEHGEGLVLRGLDFPWDEKKDGKTPHLDTEKAEMLMQMVLKRYKDEMKQTPQRVVIYKS